MSLIGWAAGGLWCIRGAAKAMSSNIFVTMVLQHRGAQHAGTVHVGQSTYVRYKGFIKTKCDINSICEAPKVQAKVTDCKFVSCKSDKNTELRMINPY